jgi:hypothetical protein
VSEEVWKDVPGYEGSYQVSNQGKVRSLDRWKKSKGDSRQLAVGKDLVLRDGFGYRRVFLRKNGVTHPKQVHRLVLESFVGPCPEGMECRHLDGDRSNNYVGNLQWGTKKENGADKVNHRNSCRGTKNNKAKLTEPKIRTIRKLRASGWKLQRIADRYKVTKQAIFFILRGDCWAYVT